MPYRLRLPEDPFGLRRGELPDDDPPPSAVARSVGLPRRLDPAVIRENRRLIEPWKRDALDLPRAGDIGTALGAYLTAGRVIASSTCRRPARAALIAA